MSDTVTLKCSKTGCPRTKRVPLDPKTMFAGTVVIVSVCPWHADGDFHSEESFDANGNPTTGEPTDA